MKKLSSGLIIIIICLIQFPAFSDSELTIPDAVKKFTANNKRIRIAVFDFANTAGTKTRFDAFIADTITTELSRYKITLLERKRLEILLKEHEFSHSGLVDQEKAVKLGMLLPVDVIVSGSYTELSGKIVINARFIHVGSGEIIYAFTSSIKNIGGDSTADIDSSDKNPCEPEWERIKSALSDLRTKAAIDNAVDIAVQTPFEGECGNIHYTVIHTFIKHKKFDDKYKIFLIGSLDKMETVNPADEKIKSIFRFFSSDGHVDSGEWSACINTLKRMGIYALHIPLGYMLNSGNEQKNIVKERINKIMELTTDKKIGRPVPVPVENMIFSIVGGLHIYYSDSDKELPAYVFKEYGHLIPDNDKNNKKAVNLLEKIYHSETGRELQKQILNILLDFYKSRIPTEQLAKEAADFIRSTESKKNSRYERDNVRIEYFSRDLKIINKELEDLYCMAAEEVKSKGYKSQIEDRTVYILKNGMKCRHTPSIKDLENEMRSRDWDKKLYAAEMFSKIGEAAVEAEDTIIKYLGLQGYGSKGGKLRRYCAQTLGNIKTTKPEAINALIELFPDYDNGVSHEAEETIAKIGLPAMPYLIKGLRHEHHAVRLRCAKALGNLGRNAKKSLPDLKKLAQNDKNPYVRKQAKGSIQMINNDF